MSSMESVGSWNVSPVNYHVRYTRQAMYTSLIMNRCCAYLKARLFCSWKRSSPLSSCKAFEMVWEVRLAGGRFPERPVKRPWHNAKIKVYIIIIHSRGPVCVSKSRAVFQSHFRPAVGVKTCDMCVADQYQCDICRPGLFTDPGS